MVVNIGIHYNSIVHPTMSRVNQAQMKKLLDLLSEDGVLVNGKVSYSSTNKQNFWKRIALQLNSVDGGVYKNTWKWCKMWADWKNKTKKKANILLRKKHYNYGQQVAALTILELRLLKMIDYPLEDKTDVLDMEMVSKVEIPEPTPDEITDFLTEGYEPPLSQHISSDEEDNTALEYIAKSKNQFCDVDMNNILQDGDSKSEEGGEPLNTDKKVKMKGKKLKKIKSLQEFKLRTTLALEKEKVQQKSEELRLRALELKLKGEELRLQEIEMNKINYLTNIEEDKLKCFKDISASLKELLDRTRNGNIRFQNVL